MLDIKELTRVEDMLWQGKPKQGFQLIFEDLLIIPFISVIVFVGTMIIITTSSIYFGVFFYAIVGSVLYNRYIKDIFSWKTTEYLITSKRIILLKNRKLMIFPFERIKHVSFKVHPFSPKFGSVIIKKEQNIFGGNNKSVPSLISGVHGGLN